MQVETRCVLCPLGRAQTPCLAQFWIPPFCLIPRDGFPCFGFHIPTATTCPASESLRPSALVLSDEATPGPARPIPALGYYIVDRCCFSRNNGIGIVDIPNLSLEAFSLVCRNSNKRSSLADAPLRKATPGLARPISGSGYYSVDRCCFSRNNGIGIVGIPNHSLEAFALVCRNSHQRSSLPGAPVTKQSVAPFQKHRALATNHLCFFVVA